jgi:putative spermidine/putrescine transport system substrate-binding protein
MVNRRFFLVGSGSLFLNQFLSSCENSEQALDIALLQGSIPPQLVRQFQRAVPAAKAVVFQPLSQLSGLYDLLKGSSSENMALVSIGDTWLAEAVQHQLIQPLNLETLPNWSKVPKPWQDLVRRDAQGYPQSTGKLWGSPYRWGGSLIVYRQDKFSGFDWTPQDWSDLWREEIKGRISLVDQPREIIGLTLKSLGYSYNTANISPITPLKAKLLQLQQQVKFYSSEHYLQPLILGDTWLAVGWSGDILPVVARNPNLKVVVPSSGTSLWADIWVKPASNTLASADILPEWLNFCWQSESAHLISLLTSGLSPVLLTEPREQIPRDILKNPFLTGDRQVLERSEFLFPLSEKSQAEYNSLWKEMRTSIPS